MADYLPITRLLRPFVQKGRDTAFSIPGTVGDACRILAIDTGDLSDLLFHSPLLSGLRERFPGSSIDFLLPDEHTPLVVPSGLARQCLVYKKPQLRTWSPGFWSLVRNVRRNEYDLSVVMSLSPQPVFELIALSCGAALRLGPSHGHAWPGTNLECRYDDVARTYRGLRTTGVSPFLGFDERLVRRAWPLPMDRQRQMRQLIHFNKPRKEELLLGVDPGRGKTGQSIAHANLHFLVQQVCAQVNCRVIALSGPGGQDRVAAFESSLTNVQTGLPRDTLLETVLLLSQCDLFLAGNTDLFHFAVALGVPTVGVFTDADGEDWDPGPLDRVRVLRVAKGKKVNIDTLMAAVEAVRRDVPTEQAELFPAPREGDGE